MMNGNVRESAKADVSNKTVKSDFHTTKISGYQKIVTSLVCGAVAGAVAKTTIAPLDMTKIHFQVSSDNLYSSRGAFKFMKQTYNQDGFLALWRGNSATMVRIVPYAAIRFCALEQSKYLFLKDGEKYLQPVQSFIAGSLAGVTASLITYPFEVARARMAVTQKSKYKSLLDVFLKVHKKEGPLTLYKGCFPTMLGMVTYGGSHFFTYESLKKYYAERTDTSVIHPFYNFIFGATAGVVGQSSSYPFDTVKRRMQTAGALGTSHIYTSCLETFRTILKNEGLKRGLYKGLSMNWIKGPIASGISFSVYEFVLLEIRKYIFRMNNGHANS